MSHNANYSEDTGYVNIHGQDVRVFVCEKTGRILIPIDELKEMGFRIYRKSQYSRLLIDDNQFSKEFDLYMLQSAQTYMLQNKIVFQENDILESIKKCKAVLTENQNTMQSSPNNFVKKEPNTSPSNFKNSFVTESSPTDITITTKLRQPSASTVQNLQSEGIFRGFTQNKSPASIVNDSKTDSSKENKFENKTRNSFERRKTNDSKFGKTESRTLFDSNISFDVKKSSSPRASTDNVQTSFNGMEAESKRDSESTDEPEKLPTIELTKPEHNVLITHIEKQNCIWVQDIENADVILDIDSKIRNEVKQEKKFVKYVWNKIFLGTHEGEWFRCKVIKYKPLTVSFVDYGNTATVSALRECSEELAKIPCQAVRLTFNESQTQYKPQVFDNIAIRVKRKFNRGTYAVDVINKGTEMTPSKSPSPIPTLKTFFTKPQSPCKLENNQRVMIIGHTDAKMAVRTRECFDKLRQLEQTLAALDPISVDKVEKGQLVVCNRNGKLQRAVVLKVGEKSAEIELLDYCEKLSVDSETLKYISESLAKEPLTYVMTPPIKGYSEAADEIIRELIEKKAKPIVVLSGGEFDLKVGDELLSHKLKLLTERSDRPLLKDFKFFKPSLGAGEYILNVYRSNEELYFASGEALEEYISCVIKDELDDDSPHEPVVGEVCYGLYQDNWSRCLILREMNSRFEVQFIDFGNLEFLKSDHLRKLTDDAKVAPILAFQCRLIGLPGIKGIEKLIQENINESDNYEINIKNFNGEVYEIEIPSLYEEIKASF